MVILTAHFLPNRRAHQGFSAAELLVAIAVLTVLVSTSLPIFANTLRRSRINGAVLQLASDIRYARSLAVARGGLYGVHTNGSAYRIERSSSDTTWSSPTIMTNWQDLSTQFTGVAIQSVGDGDPIAGPIFNTMGGSVNASNAVRSMNITLTDDSGVTKVIQISAAGNVKMP